jgi:hypothetical protein
MTIIQYQTGKKGSVKYLLNRLSHQMNPVLNPLHTKKEIIIFIMIFPRVVVKVQQQ